MNGTQRIRALVEGGPIDRTPVAGWYHMPLVDRDVDAFVAETIASTDANRWDFIKIMTNGHFYTEAYGGQIDFSRDPRKWSGTVRRYPVTSAAEARELPVLAADNPVWRRELEAHRRLADHYAGELPIVSTLFSPLTAVQELMGCLDPGPVLALMREDPAALHHALAAMVETTANYLDALMDDGLDGVFFANQYSESSILTDEQYEEFVVPYDRQVLERLAGRTWFNIAHVHGAAGLRFDDYLELPDTLLQAVNWENCPSGTDAALVSTVAGLRARTDKVLIAGIDQHADFALAPGEGPKFVKARLQARFRDMLAQNGSNRFVFGPGCVLETGGSPLNALIAEVADELGATGAGEGAEAAR